MKDVVAIDADAMIFLIFDRIPFEGVINFEGCNACMRVNNLMELSEGCNKHTDTSVTRTSTKMQRIDAIDEFINY